MVDLFLFFGWSWNCFVGCSECAYNNIWVFPSKSTHSSYHNSPLASFATQCSMTVHRMCATSQGDLSMLHFSSNVCPDAPLHPPMWICTFRVPCDVVRPPDVWTFREWSTHRPRCRNWWNSVSPGSPHSAHFASWLARVCFRTGGSGVFDYSSWVSCVCVADWMWSRAMGHTLLVEIYSYSDRDQNRWTQLWIRRLKMLVSSVVLVFSVTHVYSVDSWGDLSDRMGIWRCRRPFSVDAFCAVYLLWIRKTTELVKPIRQDIELTKSHRELTFVVRPMRTWADFRIIFHIGSVQNFEYPFRFGRERGQHCVIV